MQKERIEKVALLDARGRLPHPGWARRPMWEYERGKIASGALRIKEWDYYYLFSAEHRVMLTLTCSDLGYAGLMAVCLVDLEAGSTRQVDDMAILPMGRLDLKPDSEDPGFQFHSKKMHIDITSEGKMTLLEIVVPTFTLEGKPLEAKIRIERAVGESMNIATSWKEMPTAFYLNEKRVCMPCEGTIRIAERTVELKEETSLAGLDWGRGRWTYRNRWYWSSLSARIEGHTFGFNLGYGFSDRSVASENALFYDGKLHKLEEVSFEFDPEDYLSPWEITSSDGRVELVFNPIVDRFGDTNLLLIRSLQHQVFGTFSGTVLLDDRSPVKLDALYGFAEDVYNRW